MTAASAYSALSLPNLRSLLSLLFAVLLSALAWAENDGPPLPAVLGTQPAGTSKNDFWWSSKFDRVRFTNRSTTYYFLSEPQPDTPNPTYVFLPPVPPPLGVDYPQLGALVPGAPPAPPELSAFVNELFYPQLGARLAAGDLPKGLGQQIQAYRATRTELQNELRARIAELKDTGSQMREQQLAALAALQTPRIVALETTAEKIRTELQPTGIFGFLTGGGDAGKEETARQPSVGQSPVPEKQDLRLESKLLRHAAFYEKGLPAAQRHLLLEAAIELEALSDSTPAPDRTTGERPQLHFSPATARITLPAGLPAPLEKLIDDYSAAKNSLKAELRAALLSNEPSSEAGTQALKQLAAAQAPRLAALEVAAEEIRRGLASLPNPPGPPPPPALPPELMARISNYRRHKLELLKTLHGLLAGVRENSDPATGRGNGDPRPSALTVMRDGASAAQLKSMTLQESIDEFNRRQTALIADLNKETAGIRGALAEYVRTTGQPDDRKSIDDLLKDFEAARQKQEVWDKYRDYQVAVLMPGLSPEQRRLLFDAAVEQLALPLPSGRMVR